MFIHVNKTGSDHNHKCIRKAILVGLSANWAHDHVDSCVIIKINI